MIGNLFVKAICGVFYKSSVPSSIAILIQNMIGAVPKFTSEVSHSWHKQNVAFAAVIDNQMWHTNNANGLAQSSIVPPYIQNTKPHHISPFYDSIAKLLIAAYARLDNRVDLCRMLGISDSHEVSDNQIILQLYQKFGVNFPHKILGDFAIAIWDENKQELLCASDAMNLRPIYYFNDKNIFAFATEIRALHAMPEIKRAPDLIRVANQTIIDNFYISNDYRSYYAGVRYMPAATTLKVTRDDITSHTYWQTDLTKRIHFKTEDEYVEAFNALFTQALDARTNTTNPVGVMLSGGLDSSAITAMLMRMFKKNNRIVEAFCNLLPLDYKGTIQDEREYINYLKADNLNINYIDNPTDGPFDNLLELITHVESPNYISQQYIHKEITTKLKERNVQVLLDGIYGEMGPSSPGHGHLSALFLKGRWGYLLRESYLKASITKQNWPNLLFRSIVSPLVPEKLRELMKKGIASERSANTGLLLNSDFVNKYSTLEKHRNKLKYGIKPSLLNQRQNQANFIHYKQHTHPLTCYMEKSGVELLHPYLDRRILEFCLAIPDTMRIKNGYNRYMIRRAMHGIMPKEICERTTKAAFIPDYMERYTKDIPKAYMVLEQISTNSLVQEIINLHKLKQMIPLATAEGSAMGGQNIQAFMTVPTTLALGVFLATF